LEFGFELLARFPDDDIADLLLLLSKTFDIATRLRDCAQVAKELELQSHDGGVGNVFWAGQLTGARTDEKVMSRKSRTFHVQVPTSCVRFIPSSLLF
jgi:hypothetical protein